MRILLAYDGSTFADEAVDDLHRAGLPTAAEVVVLCAADIYAAPKPAESDQRVTEALAQAAANAQRAVDRISVEFPDWKASGESVADSPAWGIIKRAEGPDQQSWKADLIVIGAAGHSGLGRLVFGSVAQKVLMNSRRSVRVGRLKKASKSQPIRLLVGVDGSAGSSAAVDVVARRSWPAGTECRLATVVDSRLLTTPPGLLSAMMMPGDAPAKQILAGPAETLRAAGLTTSVVETYGVPSHGLLRQADEFAADCIFLGAQGLGRAERFLVGSVSSSLAMRAKCSVEVIHPD